MEESKDLQSIYKIFRTFIYLSLIIEVFEYAITPGMLTFWGGILADIHGRIKLMDIYQDGHLLHSKIMTLLIICVTCIGTRNKKHLEFNAKRMVIYPLSFGLILMFLSVWLFYRDWTPYFFSLHSSTWLYFLMSVVGTVRSNKVSVTLGFQELSQLESDYGKVGMQKVITTVGNVVSGSARAKENLEWLSNDIIGKVVQLKKGVTIDRDKTSINLNENMDSLVPGSKIADMPSGWICGQTARDFIKTKTGRSGSMDIQEAEEFKTSKFFCKTDFDMAEIAKEEKAYAQYPLPKFYNFPSVEARERILYANFLKVNQEVKDMIAEIQEFYKK